MWSNIKNIKEQKADLFLITLNNCSVVTCQNSLSIKIGILNINVNTVVPETENIKIITSMMMLYMILNCM